MSSPHDNRDAGTGRFVTDEAAAADPEGTVREARGAQSAPQRPSPGRVVHYVSHGTPVRPDGTQAFTSQCRAATVTEVDPGDPAVVGLAVTNPTGLFFHPLSDGGCTQMEYPEGHDGPLQGGTWHWPERV